MCFRGYDADSVDVLIFFHILDGIVVKDFYLFVFAFVEEFLTEGIDVLVAMDNAFLLCDGGELVALAVKSLPE